MIESAAAGQRLLQRWREADPWLTMLAATVALTFGADHLDAVPAADDLSLGPRRGPVQDVERNIAAAGFRAEEFRATA